MIRNLLIILLVLLSSALKAQKPATVNRQNKQYDLIGENTKTGISEASLKAFPSPFVKEITISYRLEKSGRVELGVYNLLGQQIKEISRELQQPGRYQFKWDGADRSGKSVSSGMYYVILRMNDDRQVVKIMKSE